MSKKYVGYLRLAAEVLRKHEAQYHAQRCEEAASILEELLIQVTAVSGERVREALPISEVSIPMTEVVTTPCQGCGKRPIDFISGDALPLTAIKGDTNG